VSVLGYPWRVGSQVGRTLYIDTGEKHPSNLFGLVDDEECAQHIVDLHNAWWSAQHELDLDHNDGQDA